MDGALPSIPGAAATPGVSFAPASPNPMTGMSPAMQPRPANPPGRPSGDPEVQMARAERHREQQRIESVLPRQATDSKILVYKIGRNGRVIPGAKPFLTILMSEIEKYRREQDAGGDPTDGIDLSEEYIRERILTKAGPDCTATFQCRVADKKGQPMSSIAPFTVSLTDEEPDDEGGDGLDYEEEEPFNDPRYNAHVPTVPHGAPHLQMAAPPPPSAPSMDPAGLASVMRAERQQEAQRSNEMLTAVATLNSGQQQAMAQMQQMLVQFQIQAQKDAADREERERARRSEFRQTLMTMVPLVLPLVQKMFERPSGPTPEMAALLEIVKGKSGEDATSKITSLMTEVAKANTQMQAAGAQTMIDAQSKMTGTMVSMVLEQMRSLVKQSAPEKESSGGLAELAAAVLPALMANNAQAQQPPPQQTPAPQPPPQQQAPVQRRPRSLPAPAAPAQNPAPVPSAPRTEQSQRAPRDTPRERIAGCLDTIARLSVGDIPGGQLWGALQWCEQTMPPNLREAVKAGNEAQVMAICGPVVMRAPRLKAWLGHGPNVAFLRERIDDLGLLITGSLTQERANASMQRVTAFAAEMRAALTQAASGQAPAPAPAPAPAQVEPQPTGETVPVETSVVPQPGGDVASTPAVTEPASDGAVSGEPAPTPAPTPAPAPTARRPHVRRTPPPAAPPGAAPAAG